jgi:hypothetical protein
LPLRVKWFIASSKNYAAHLQGQPFTLLVEIDSPVPANRNTDLTFSSIEKETPGFVND